MNKGSEDSLLVGGASGFWKGKRKASSLSAPLSRDIYLVSNSLLFAIDEQILGQEKAPPIVVLVPMWLEKTHESFHGCSWGQTPLGLPVSPRSVFKNLFPDHPDEEFMTWKQIIDMRESQIATLRKKHDEERIVLFDLREKDIAQYERGELLSIENKNGLYVIKTVEEVLYQLPENELGKVYNFLSRPRASKPSPVSEDRLVPCRPHTQLYYNSPNSVPKSVIIKGTGLSSVWVKKHFPNIENLFVLGRLGSQLPQIPSNAEVDYGSIHLITVDNLMIPDQKPGYLAVAGPDGSIIAEINIDTAYFTAIGYEPYLELTSCIPGEKLSTYQMLENLPWTAPRNIPVGSLTHRLMLFYSHQEAYNDLNSCYEMQYYVDQITPNILKENLKNKALNLDVSFFNNLKARIDLLPDPLDRDSELQLYIEVFKGQTPSPEEVEEFSAAVDQMQSQIETRNLLPDNTTSLLIPKS